MWDLSDYIVVILTIFGIIFPGEMIKAIRSQDSEKSNKHEILSCLCFGAIMFLIGILLND